MTRLVMQLLKTRWGVIILAPVAAAVGIIALLFTIPAHYVRIDGTVASYTVIHNAIGQYDHNELRLTGDPAVYKLDDGEYSPAPPDALPAGAPVSIWVDQGHPWIMALTVASATGGSPRTYTTFPYDHPDQNLLAGRIIGSLFIVLGFALLIVGLAWERMPWRKRLKPTYTPTYLAPGMYDQDQPWRG